MSETENRIAVMAILVEEAESVAAMNELLHQYAPYIIGRMGIPYREKGVSVLSVALDAPQPVTSALAGKLGMLPGISIKTLHSKK